MKTLLSTMINGIKLWTRSLVQSTENKLQSDIDNVHTAAKNARIEASNAQIAAENAQATGEIQSDWAQNDDTAVDYVKNRPFYSEYEYEEIIGETITLTGTEPSQYNRFFDELMNYNQDTICVTWDGVMYMCKYNDYSYNGGYSFGDNNLNSYPFFFYANYGSGYIKGHRGEHTYSLHAPTEIVHKLSNKYYDLTGSVRYDESQELDGLQRKRVLDNVKIPSVVYIDIFINDFFNTPVINRIEASPNLFGVSTNSLRNMINDGKYEDRRCAIVAQMIIQIPRVNSNLAYRTYCTMITMPEGYVKIIAHPPRSIENPNPDYSREIIVDYHYDNYNNPTITVQNIE